MKYVIVKINKQNVPGQRMKYPVKYNAYEVDANKIGPIVYEGGLGRGQPFEECMICLTDGTADKYAIDPDMRIVSETVANQWLATNKQEKDKPDETVTDVNRLIAIQVKIAAGISLSQEDNDALDPDKATKGISRKKKLVTEIFK